jgi:ATP phosphoribosyltransferase
LHFGKCKLCIQAPIHHHITEVKQLAGKRIVTSFPVLAKQFFDQLDSEHGTVTTVRFVSGSVEAACGLGLADAVVDLVETGTTMRVRNFRQVWLIHAYVLVSLLSLSLSFFPFYRQQGWKWYMTYSKHRPY